MRVRGTHVQHGRHVLLRIVRTRHPREQVRDCLPDDVTRPQLLAPARLRVHVPSLVLAEERARRRPEVPAPLAMARALPAEMRVAPAKVDRVAPRQGVAGRLAFRLGRSRDRIGGRVDGRAGRGEAVGFVGDFVVGGGAARGRGMGAACGGEEAAALLGIDESRPSLVGECQD